MHFMSVSDLLNLVMPFKYSLSMVLYMSFDKFLLAVESRDLSQADKSIIIVYSFPKLSDG